MGSAGFPAFPMPEGTWGMDTVGIAAYLILGGEFSPTFSGLFY